MKRLLLILLILPFVYLHKAEARGFHFDDVPGVNLDDALPRINLIVDISKVQKDELTKALIEVKEFSTAFGEKTERYNCSIKYRGASSIIYEKKSFAVKIEDERGDKMDVNLLGLRLENNWILDAMAIDHIRMRNRVCFDIWNEISKTPYDTEFGNRNGTVGRFVEVFINGDYHGLYCLTDKIDRKLLGLKKYKEEKNGSYTVRGILYKGVYWGISADLLEYDGSAPVDDVKWNAFELTYPDDIPSFDTWKPLVRLIDFCSAETSDRYFIQNFEKWFYTDNLIDYVAFTFLLNVGDNAYKNTYLSVPDITKAHQYLITPWDMDMSLGGNWDGDYVESHAWLERYNWTAPFNRLYKKNINGFADKVKEKIAELSTTFLSEEQMSERLDAYVSLFTKSGAWAREYAKWNGNPVPLEKNLRIEKGYVMKWYMSNLAFLLDYTSISDTEITGISQGDDIFTLDGRRVLKNGNGSLPRGLFIKGGKKIFVR